MINNLPIAIRDNCLDFSWDNEKVWKLNLPVEKMAISKLAWQFDLPFWKYGKVKYAITPNQVMANPRKFRYQYNRTMNSDLKYPVHIAKNKKGKWEMLDGLHRVVKAKALGHRTIKVKKVYKKHIKDIVKANPAIRYQE
ncbi:hypothetical protein KKG41_03265 [Patescibacteria group bacterium]|nr:hypothetical protein [Patescibacteria group bacterium]MBU1890092.1 hypothetical protein [Patescibacteria group bacterium]